MFHWHTIDKLDTDFESVKLREGGNKVRERGFDREISLESLPSPKGASTLHCIEV